MKIIKWVVITVVGISLMSIVFVAWHFYKNTKDPYVKNCDYSVPDSLIPKFAEVPINFRHEFNKEKSQPSVGSAMIDIDGDGIDELFIGGGYSQQDAIYYFENNRFEPWKGILPTKTSLATMGAVSYDWDGDGKTDLLVTRDDGVFFYRNEGDKFTETKLAIRLNENSNPATITLGDVNKDGVTDIFLSTYITKEKMEGQTIFNKKGYGSSSVLLLNNGDNALTDVTDQYGLTYIHNTFQGLFVDIDEDGWLDLVVAYDTGEPRIYKNNNGKKFTAIANPMTGKFGYPMGIAAGDINNDGKVDLFFSNTGSSIPHFMAKGDLRDDQKLVTDWLLFKNNGNLSFTDVAKELNVADFEFSWGCLFRDFNLDGRQDLVVAENYVSFPPHALFPLPCRFLIQLPSGKFASVEEQAGVMNKNFAITPLTGDFNNDGYPDLIYINIDGPVKAYINKGGNAGYVKVRMPETNESLGAKVTLSFSDGTHLSDWNLVGEGLGSDQSNMLHFAVVQHKIPESVTIKYNSNRVQIIKNIRAGMTVRP